MFVCDWSWVSTTHTAERWVHQSDTDTRTRTRVYSFVQLMSMLNEHTQNMKYCCMIYRNYVSFHRSYDHFEMINKFTLRHRRWLHTQFMTKCRSKPRRTPVTIPMISNRFGIGLFCKSQLQQHIRALWACREHILVAMWLWFLLSVVSLKCDNKWTNKEQEWVDENHFFFQLVRFV